MDRSGISRLRPGALLRVTRSRRNSCARTSISVRAGSRPFSASCALSLGLAIYFPSGFLIGPLVYALPHVFSSMRYFHHSVVARRDPTATMPVLSP